MKMDLPRLSRSRGAGLEGGPRKDGTRKAVFDYFYALMNEGTREDIGHAQYDLHEGPPGPDDERDQFEKVVKRLSKWWGEYGQDIWYDRDAGIIYDSKPSDEDIESGDIIEIDAADARQYVFGKELAPMIRRG